MVTQRQGADALARDFEDGITHRRQNRRDARFADAAGVFCTRYDVYIHLGRFVVPDHWIIGKVVLHDTAILDGDLSFQRRSQAVQRTAFHLSFDGVGIDDPSRVDSNPHFVDFHCAVRNRDLGDLADDAAESFHNSNSAAMP